MNIFNQTCLKGVKLIRPLTNFEDFRGNYVEIYNQQAFKANGFAKRFVQDDVSISKKNVLRGIHGDDKTWKLVSCLHGAFYIIVVNNDSNSEEFGKWQGFTLSEYNKLSLLIPPKFGNGHLVLTEKAVFYYKQTTYYGDIVTGKQIGRAHV